MARKKRPVIPPPCSPEPARPLGDPSTLSPIDQAAALAQFREEPTPVLLKRRRPRSKENK